jgi:hypothetical protein
MESAELTDLNPYVYYKQKIEEWQKNIGSFYTLEEDKQQQVYAFSEDVLQKIFRNSPEELLPEPHSLFMKDFYTLDFGGNTHTVAEKERLKAIREYLEEEWVPLANPFSFDMEGLPPKIYNYIYMKRRQYPLRILGTRDPRDPREKIPSVKETFEALDNLMNRYDNALDELYSRGDASDELDSIEVEFEQKNGFDDYLDDRIYAYISYLEDEQSGINGIPRWWKFTGDYAMDMDDINFFQTTKSMRNKVLRIIDTLYASKSIDDEVKRYTEARIMIGANGEKQQYRVGPEHMAIENMDTMREWFNAYDKTREWFNAYFVDRTREIKYQLEEIREEYLDRKSQMSIMIHSKMKSETALKILYLFQEKYNNIPNYIKDRLLTDPRIELYGIGIIKESKEGLKYYGGLAESLMGGFGETIEMPGGGTETKIIRPHLPPEIVFDLILPMLTPIAKGDRDMLFLAMLFRRWMIQKNPKEYIKKYRLINPGNMKPMVFLPYKAQENEKKYKETITVFSPDKVKEVLNELMRCVTLLRRIIEDIESDTLRKRTWNIMMSDELRLYNQFRNVRLKPDKCLQRAKFMILNTLNKLIYMPFATWDDTLNKLIENPLDEIIGNPLYKPENRTEIMENVEEFTKFLYEKKLTKEDMPSKEEALSEERIRKKAKEFLNKGRNLFNPKAVSRRDVLLKTLENVERNQLWKEFWDFWIPTIRAVFPNKRETRNIFYGNMKYSTKLCMLAYAHLKDTKEIIDKILNLEEGKGKRKRSPSEESTEEMVSAKLSEEEGQEYW